MLVLLVPFMTILIGDVFLRGAEVCVSGLVSESLIFDYHLC